MEQQTSPAMEIRKIIENGKQGIQLTTEQIEFLEDFIAKRTAKVISLTKTVKKQDLQLSDCAKKLEKQGRFNELKNERDEKLNKCKNTKINYIFGICTSIVVGGAIKYFLEVAKNIPAELEILAWLLFLLCAILSPVSMYKLKNEIEKEQLIKKDYDDGLQFLNQT